MVENKAVSELKLFKAKSIIATVVNLQDKALLLEKELGLDYMYTLISMGQSLGVLADSVGMTIFQLEFILKRTSSLKRQYINAKTMALVEGSMITLGKHDQVLSLEREESNAMKHHSNMLDKALKIVNTLDTDASSNNVTINNTVVVRDKDDIPKLPNDLTNLIEGEAC